MVQYRTIIYFFRVAIGVYFVYVCGGFEQILQKRREYNGS